MIKALIINMQKETTANRLFLFLFIGSLSIQFAEVLSGSSQIWFFNWFALLVTFPLYLTHVLFYYSLAHKTDRLELRHLYLWGILFGLYEAPVTKVLFSGYIGQKPLLGTVGGIAIFEFVSVVLFWHPVFSFIIPILIYESFLIHENKANLLDIPGSHLKIITIMGDKKKIFLILIFSIFLAPLQARADGFLLLNTLLAQIGTLAIVVLFWFLAKRKNKWEIDSIVLGKKGMIITISLIIFYYIFGWILTPQPAAKTPLAYVILMIFILLIISLIYFDKTKIADLTLINSENILDKIITFKFYVLIILFLSLFSAIFCLVPFIGNIIAIFTYLLIALLGIILFPYYLYNFVRSR